MQYQFVIAGAALALSLGFAHADLADPQLAEDVRTVVARADGPIAIAVEDLATGERFAHEGGRTMPMQSVFKAMLGAAVLAAVDGEDLTLDQTVDVTRADLAMQWSPLADEFSGERMSFTVGDLLERAVAISDNSAADILMRLIGGPETVTTFLQDAGVANVSIDRYEREFQAELLGLPPYAEGKVIDQAEYEAAAAAVPQEEKEAAFAAYLKADEDGATAEGGIAFLKTLAAGDLLSRASTTRLLDIMTAAPTGADRLKAGLPEGATLAHKTGTGGTVLGRDAGTNHIGIARLPDGTQLAVAVFMVGSTLNTAERDAIHADIMRAVVKAAGK